MGLDVYLYRYEDRAKSEELEGRYEEEAARVWKEGDGRRYEDIPEEEKEANQATLKAFAAELGLSEWGEDERYKQRIELPSALYPEHMFKIGYMRSSYNGGGIDSRLRTAIGKDLAWVFETSGNESKVDPDWKSAAERARKALSEWNAHAVKAPFRVREISLFHASDSRVTAHDEASALKVFLQERAAHQNRKSDHPFDAYSSVLGLFNFGERADQVRGFITGRSQPRRGPAVYVVCEADPSEFEWYAHALEIVAEMCEWVLAQPDSEKYVLHWSA